MNQPLAIKALMFDVFGTVVDWRTSIQDEMTAFFTPLGIEKDWEAFAQDWRAKYQPSMEKVRAGNREYVRLDELHRENLDELLADYELESLNEEQRDFINHVWHRLVPWKDTVPGLVRLQRRFLLTTLSNGNIALMANLAKNSGLPWDAILGAEVTQSYKPDPVTYTRSMEVMALKPAECMMVAAHNYDLKVARSLGMKTAFVARPNEYGDRQKTDFEADDDWDICCNSMIELAQHLEA